MLYGIFLPRMEAILAKNPELEEMRNLQFGRVIYEWGKARRAKIEAKKAEEEAAKEEAAAAAEPQEEENAE